MEGQMALFDDDRNRGFRGYDRQFGEGGGRNRFEESFRGRDPNDLDRGRYGATGHYGRDVSPTEAGWRGGQGGLNRGGWNAGGQDRDLGHHWAGRTGYDREMRGDDRNFLERGWDRLTSNDYDRGYRGSSAYDRSYRSSGYGTDFGRTRYGSEYGTSGYNRGLGEDPWYGRDRGYDVRDYKSRQQIDAGDPFGDRQSRTPIRMVNEDYSDRLARRNAYDADIRRDRDWF
jgi:hypothetical protein